MKTLFVHLALIFVTGRSLPVVAQIDLDKRLASFKESQISNRVELGKPVGEKNSKSIGPEGGTIYSNDGKMKLIVPQGALTQTTTISIQPVANMNAAGVGNAYDCEPSGLQFLTPATVVFNYSDSEVRASPSLQDLGYLDKQGEWHDLEKISIDTINKIISANVNHFTQLTRKLIFVLNLPEETIHVSKSAFKLLLPGVIPDKYGDIKQDRLAVLDNFFENERFRWYVNGIENGDAANGRISFKGFKQSNGMAANYIAPAIVPENNPVKITVEMDGPITLNNGITVGSISASAYVTVVGDQYHFTYIHIDENGCYFMVDSSSCIINMDRNKTTLTNIINYKPWSDWPNCGGCKYNWTNKATIKGLAEITGMASATVTPPNDQSSATKVYITLLPAMGNTPSAIVYCKKDTRNIPSMPMPAEPKYINFDIDGDDIVIHYMGKTARNELVIPMDKEKTMIYMYKLP